MTDTDPTLPDGHSATTTPGPTVPPAERVRSSGLLRTAGFSVWSGGLIGVLAYLTKLPFGDMVPVTAGLAFSFSFGAVAGLLCSPLIVLALASRDLTAAKPIVLWSTAAVTCGLATVVTPVLLEMVLAAGTFVLAALAARFFLPRVWDRAGLCRYCGYDIRASLEFGRCPECGSRFDRRPWYAARPTGKSVRDAALGCAHVLFRFPSLALIIIVLVRLAPLAGAEVLRESRCRPVMSALAQAVADHRPFDLGACTTFAWDEVIIFGPYTDRATIEQTLGYPWPMAERTGISSSDSFNLLVFLHDGHVAAHMTIPIRWNFQESLLQRRIARADAVFLSQEHRPDHFILRLAKDGP